MSRQQDLIPVVEPVTPMQMLQIAVQQGADLDKLQKLMDLQERWEKNEATKAYFRAMQAFKANPPVIYKDKHVKFGNTEYDHALLENAVELIGKAMSEHGLDFHWETSQSDNKVTVTCIITHVQGHSEKVPLSAGLDTSGSKNNIQALGSTITYLQRYSLFAATGLAAKGVDDDGRTAEFITEKQVADLKALLEEVGGNEQALCGYLKIDSLDKIPVQAYSMAIAVTEAKRKKK